MVKIVIIGFGVLGSAIKKKFDLAGQSFQSEITVVAWDKFQPPADLDLKRVELRNLLQGANFVFFCVGASQLRSALFDVYSVVDNGFVSVLFSKGLDSQSGLNVSDLFEKDYPQKRYVLASGPMLALELDAGMAGYASLVSRELQVLEGLSDILSKAGIYNEMVLADPSGYAYLGVLKNIYSVFLGAIDSLLKELGLMSCSNLKGYLFLEIYKEMSLIIDSLGYDPRSLNTMAGLADLISTGISPLSVNYQSGYSLVQAGVVGKKGEGLASLENMLKKITLSENSVPIIHLLKLCFASPNKAREMMQDYLQKLK